MARSIAFRSNKDLIAAQATGAGVAAIAIVRMSGGGALEAADRIFSKGVSSATPGMMQLGVLHLDGERIDQCLAVAWRGPNSFTGEDLVEFHVHGSPAVVEAALAACKHVGARAAESGEFTRRAFLNDKLDLAQAEAVCDLTNAQTDDARRAALAQLQGGISGQVDAVRRDLVQVTAELEAGVDYPEEDLPPTAKEKLLRLMDESINRLHGLLATYERGKRLRHGARVVFAGAPNAGKSSLFNALLRRERAIVTPHPGTTRDTLEATVELAGIPLTIVDTAGLRIDAEEIEAMGIQRTREQIEAADLTLFVVDPCEDVAGPLREYGAVRGVPHLVLFNKCDVVSGAGVAERFVGDGTRGQLEVSAFRKETLAVLEEVLVAELGGRSSEGGAAAMVTSARHEAALRIAAESAGIARAGIAGGTPAELVVIDLATALSAVDEITGRGQLDEDILDAIFSTFCLGK